MAHPGGMAAFSINACTDLTLTGITIDGSAGDSLGANTDGFDIGSSTSVTISRANVYNHDDCVAINSGVGITFTGGVCSGGHGLIRWRQKRQHVLFESSEIKASQNGVRIKIIAGDTGTVSGVTYKDVTLSGITKYGITVVQEAPSSILTLIPIPAFIELRRQITILGTKYRFPYNCKFHNSKLIITFFQKV
ncbi:hypothetical protein BDZ45DRAFT_740880 [Acephala macrosclerotiorum]|nr:hypothetical protein BDZ45DRAFT_740880 [Acephala macrosclerotiorum]